jgi:hypothetical protein
MFDFLSSIKQNIGATFFWGGGLFPDALQILGFYHLAENIYRFGKYLFQGDEKLYTPWAEELIELLRNSQSEEVLRRLEQYKEKAFLPEW